MNPLDNAKRYALSISETKGGRIKGARMQEVTHIGKWLDIGDPVLLAMQDVCRAAATHVNRGSRSSFEAAELAVMRLQVLLNNPQVDE